MRNQGWIAVVVVALAIGVAGAQQSNTNSNDNKNTQNATSPTPKTAQSETQNNTAGSIAGNSGAIGATTGQTTPQDPNTPQKSAAGNNAPAGNATKTIENTPSAPQNTKPEASGEKSATRESLGMTPDVDSKTLEGEIDSALKSDPTLANSQVNVQVSDSQITLSGSVPSGKDKVTATRIAQSYAGNRRVKDQVTVAGRQQKPETTTTQPNAMGTNPK